MIRLELHWLSHLGFKRWFFVHQGKHIYSTSHGTFKPPNPQSHLYTFDLQNKATTLITTTYDPADTHTRLPCLSLNGDRFLGSDVHVLWLLSTLDIVPWRQPNLLTRTQIQPHALSRAALAVAVIPSLIFAVLSAAWSLTVSFWCHVRFRPMDLEDEIKLL